MSTTVVEPGLAATAFARLESEGRLLNPVLKAPTKKPGRFGFRGELALRFAAKLADEARHNEVLQRYVDRRLEGEIYPLGGNVREIFDTLLGTRSWHLKTIGLQLVAETFAVSLFRMTSDAFFARPDAAVCTGVVDVAFIDGLHHYDQVLRDLAHVERIIADIAEP